uniref:Uncharacterized protein n=1 Tax=Romanomermis culicivorax TaxID=13658 RepID=A0A915J9J1_ROMCU
MHIVGRHVADKEIWVQHCLKCWFAVAKSTQGWIPSQISFTSFSLFAIFFGLATHPTLAARHSGLWAEFMIENSTKANLKKQSPQKKDFEKAKEKKLPLPFRFQLGADEMTATNFRTSVPKPVQKV